MTTNTLPTQQRSSFIASYLHDLGQSVLFVLPFIVLMTIITFLEMNGALPEFPRDTYVDSYPLAALIELVKWLPAAFVYGMLRNALRGAQELRKHEGKHNPWHCLGNACIHLVCVLAWMPIVLIIASIVIS